MKTCGRCNEQKSTEDFYKASNKKDGLQYVCKICQRDYAMAKRRDNPEWERAKVNRSYKKHREKRLSHIREYIRKNRAKVYARYAIFKAKKTGRLIEPKLCQICLKCPPIAAHHEDYNKALDVIWLCGLCHATVHIGRRMNGKSTCASE